MFDDSRDGLFLSVHALLAHVDGDRDLLACRKLARRLFADAGQPGDELGQFRLVAERVLVLVEQEVSCRQPIFDGYQ